MAVAAMDRLVHHCQGIGIKGESYCQKAAATRVLRNPGATPTSLTRAPWRARSTEPPLQSRERCRQQVNGPQAASNSLRSQLDWRDATGMGTILFQPKFQTGCRTKTQATHRSTRLKPPVNLIDIRQSIMPTIIRSMLWVSFCSPYLDLQTTSLNKHCDIGNPSI